MTWPIVSVEIYLVASDDGRKVYEKRGFEVLQKATVSILEGAGIRWTETVVDTAPNKTVSR